MKVGIIVHLWNTMTIPHIIHQIWYQGAGAVPPKYRAYSETWKRLHPKWEVRLWDFEACRRLMAERYPEYLELWNSYPLDIQRIDAIRYFILHAYGGIYLDMDIECLKPIDSLLEDCRFLLSRTIKFNNAVMGSCAEHEFWPKLFPELVKAMQTHRQPRGFIERLRGEGIYIVETAGPAIFSRIVEETGVDTSSDTRVCPKHIFEPHTAGFENGKFVQDNDTSRSFAIHHSAGEWVPRELRVAYFLAGLVFRIKTYFNK